MSGLLLPRLLYRKELSLTNGRIPRRVPANLILGRCARCFALTVVGTSRDEWVHRCLIGGPSLPGVGVQYSFQEMNEKLGILLILGRTAVAVELDDIRKSLALEVPIGWLLFELRSASLPLGLLRRQRLDEFGPGLEPPGRPRRGRGTHLVALEQPQLRRRLGKELHKVLAGLDALLQHPIREVSDHLAYPPQLVVLMDAGQDGQAQIQLGRDAAEGPHVDGRVIFEAHQNLGAAVEARLDVGVGRFALEAGRAKVDQFDPLVHGCCIG
mmetsp:Transcript_14855/g.42829  ORF Transcript_14855/g.42829 Transcript_14855/m.42829 type:complete len:269 (-) Transcript_14855:984-1790(-)